MDGSDVALWRLFSQGGEFRELFVFATLTDFLIVLRVPRNQKLLPFGTALEGTTKGGDSEVSKLVLCGISDETFETEAPADQ